MFEAARPWLILSLLLLGLIALSLPVAIAHGTPITTWLRDAATYGLCAAAPVFALDAASSMRWRLVFSLTIVMGFLGRFRSRPTGSRSGTSRSCRWTISSFRPAAYRWSC